MSFNILGTGSAVPKLTVTNDDLAKFMDTTDEWIVSKTGIKQRHLLSKESVTDLAFDAARAAILDSKINVSDIDMVIGATILGDTVTPSMACLVSKRLSLRVPSFDINAACSGFVYALDVATGFLTRGRAKKILLICAEHLSRLVDWTDRGSCVLFGDGAAAVVLEKGSNLLAIDLTCNPNDEFLVQYYDGGISPFNERAYERPYLRMNGQEVYRFAVNAVCTDLKNILKKAKLEEKDISHFLLHQANKRIIDTAISSCKYSREKFYNSIERTGNVSAASVPILLDELNKSGKLKRGDIIAISAFGAGLTTGSAVVRW